MVTAPLIDNDYLNAFREHILRRSQTILTDIQQVGISLPDKTLKQSLRLLEHSLKLSDVWPNTRALLLILAPKMEQAGYRDEWLPYLEQGVRQCQQLGDAETEAELHLQLGILFQLRGKYEAAQSHLEASANGFTILNDAHGQARALNHLAFVAQRQCRFEEATHLVETALQLLPNGDSERAFSYFVLGMVALEKRRWTAAVEYLEKSFELWETENDRRMMGRTLTLLGSALHRMEKNTEAIKTYERAIALLEAVNDPVHRAMAQMNLGNVYISLSQLQAALEYLVLAEKTFRQAQDQLHLAHVIHNIGMVYRRLKRWPEAIEAYQTSIKLWEQLGNVERMVNTMDGLGLVHFERGDFLTAKAIFEEALARLKKIEGEPGYEHKFKMVTADLQQTLEAIASIQA